MIRGHHQNKTSKRAVFYVRTSQLKPLGEIHELQAQLERCTDYCLEHGYIMPHDQRYTEMQAGSVDNHRPALARLGEAVRQGCVAVVVVSSLDRLARDRAESTLPVEELKAAGATIAIDGA